MAIKKVIKIQVDKDQAEKDLKDLNKNVEKDTKQTSKLVESLTEKLDNLTGGFISKAKGFISGLGGMSVGFKGVGVAIAASGIGLIVLTIVAVGAAFKSSEAGQNKFAKYMGIIGSVVGNVVDLLSDLGEIIIEAFENPQETFEAFKKALKDNVETRLNGLLTLLPKLGAAVKLLFEGEFSAAAKVATNAVGQVVTGIDSVTDAFDQAIDKVKEFGIEIQKDAALAEKIAGLRAKADKADRNLIIARAIAVRDFAELRRKAVDSEKYEIDERIKFLEAAGEKEKALSNASLFAARLRRDAIIQENTLSKSNKEALLEEAEARAKVIELETASIEKQKELITEKNGLIQAQRAIWEAARTAQEADVQKDKDIETKRLEDIQTIKDDFEAKIFERDTELESVKLEAEREKHLLELEQLGADLESKKLVNQFYDKEITNAEKRESEARTQQAIAEKEAKGDILNAQANLALQFSSVLKKIGEKNKAAAIAGIIVEQVASGAKIISNLGIANAKAAAQFPTTGGLPFTAINTISAGLSIATGLASAKKSIAKLGGGGGGISADKPAQATTTPPAVNVVGDSNTNQIVGAINSQNQQPIKAYVVEKDVTTAQELERNKQSDASFG